MFALTIHYWGQSLLSVLVARRGTAAGRTTIVDLSVQDDVVS